MPTSALPTSSVRAPRSSKLIATHRTNRAEGTPDEVKPGGINPEGINPDGITFRITLRPAPVREPPFDDELSTPSPFCNGEQHLPFALALAGPGTAGPSGTQANSDSGSAAELSASLGDPGAFGRSLLTGCFEVMHGRLSPVQLTQLVSRSVFTGLAHDLNNPDIARRWPIKSAVQSVHHCIPVDGVAEVAAVIRSNGRVRAAALRLEAQHGKWRCVKLQLG